MDRVKALSDGNSQFRQWRAEHPNASYGGQCPEFGAAGTKPLSQSFTISRPLSSAIWDSLSAAKIGKGGPGSPTLPDPDSSNGYNGMNRNRPGTPKEPIDPNTCKNGTMENGANAGTAVAQTTASILQEIANGNGSADVYVWETKGNSGYYILGVSHSDGQQIVDRWIGVPKQ